MQTEVRKKGLFLGSQAAIVSGDSRYEGAKPVPFSEFLIKNDHQLPRQAWDKHKRNIEQNDRFSCTDAIALLPWAEGDWPTAWEKDLTQLLWPWPPTAETESSRGGVAATPTKTDDDDVTDDENEQKEDGSSSVVAVPAPLRPAAAVPLVIDSIVRSTNTTGCLDDYKGDREDEPQECAFSVWSYGNAIILDAILYAAEWSPISDEKTPDQSVQFVNERLASWLEMRGAGKKAPLLEVSSFLSRVCLAKSSCSRRKTQQRAAVFPAGSAAWNLTHGVTMPWPQAVGDTIGLYPFAYLSAATHASAGAGSSNATDLGIARTTAGKYILGAAGAITHVSCKFVKNCLGIAVSENDARRSGVVAGWPVHAADGTITRLDQVEGVLSCWKGGPLQPAAGHRHNGSCIWADDSTMGLTLIARMVAAGVAASGPSGDVNSMRRVLSAQHALFVGEDPAKPNQNKPKQIKSEEESHSHFP